MLILMVIWICLFQSLAVDYFFDKKKKFFYFFQHESANRRIIKYYKWEGAKIVQFKEIYENN